MSEVSHNTRRTLGTRRGRPAFTIVEVISVIVIIGVLAAVAAPALLRSLRRSRASEALMNVEQMWTGALAYYHAEHGTADGAALGHQFPHSSPATPAALPSSTPYEPTDGDWTQPTWQAINFGMTGPHRYQYLFFNLLDCNPPGGGGAAFEAGGPFGSAGGPLDGATGMWAPDGTVICQPHKQLVCHNNNTIAVATPAVLNAHLNHGDTGGMCANDDAKLFRGGFYAVASGDLDGDGDYSTFYRSGFIMPGGDIAGMPVVYEESPSE